MKFLFTLILFLNLYSFMAVADDHEALLPHQSGECSTEVLEDFSVVIRYCETAQFSAKNNTVCLGLIDEFLSKYPEVQCEIPRKTASGVNLEPYVLDEEMLLNTKDQLMGLFDPSGNYFPNKQ